MQEGSPKSEGLPEHIGTVVGTVFGKPVTLSLDVGADRLARLTPIGEAASLLELTGEQAERLRDLLNEAVPISNGEWPRFERSGP